MEGREALMRARNLNKEQDYLVINMASSDSEVT
jgi:hypothetical protein